MGGAVVSLNNPTMMNCIQDEFNPAKMQLPCELKGSVETTRRGVILAGDITESMEQLLPDLINNELPRLMRHINESVLDEHHIMFMGVGNVAAGDRAPLQVTQFKTPEEAIEQFKRICFAGHNDGNGSESYILPWYFAAKHTKLACYDKRGQKGLLFTFGDDGPAPSLAAHEVREVFGEQDSLSVRRLTARECLAMAAEKFNCYHIIMKGYAYDSYVVSRWRGLMESHVCVLDNHKYMPELVTTIILMNDGLSKTEALAKLNNPIAKRVVEKALEYHEEVVN